MNVKSKGITLHIETDEQPLHPREDCDNFGTLLCWHKSYNLGDKNPYSNPREFTLDKKLQEEIFVILDVFLLDHSGLRLSVRPFTAVDPQHWDSGQIGYIFATESKVKEVFGDLSYESELMAKDELLREIEDYDEFFASDYYSYSIEDEEGEIIDTCGSFNGKSMKDMLIEMKETAEPQYAFLFDKMIERQSGSFMY